MDPALKQIEHCYDKVAHIYAHKFQDELEHKPLDRDLLERFARRNGGNGIICDLGCGPGQVASFLWKIGCRAIGADLSAGMVAEASRLHPEIPFRQENMLELSFQSGALAGIVAFYSIVNLPKDALALALAEMHRVLQPDGELLLSFHIGNHEVHVDRFLEQEAQADFYFYDPDEVLRMMAEAGFAAIDTVIRYPYPEVEFASKRAYLHAVKTA